MGRNKGKGRGFLAGKEIRPASPLEWGAVGDVREASGVAEHPGGDCQGLGWGVELPRGIDTPRVDEFSGGTKSPE